MQPCAHRPVHWNSQPLKTGRLERDPLEIDLSISTEAIYADFFGGLYDLTIAFYLLQLSVLVLAL